MKKRDANIELFRVILMFGIVVLHAAYVSIGPFYWLNSGLMWCVDGFVLITGFYGLKFSFLKLVRLYVWAAVCSILVELMALAILGEFISFAGVLRGSWRHLCSSWFLHAYALMMCLSPIGNVVFEMTQEKCRGWRSLICSRTFLVLLPFLFSVFVWGFSTELPYLHRIIPSTPGLSSFTGLTLFAVYLIGRLYRVFDLGRSINTLWLVSSLPLLFSIQIIGYGWFGHYASPFSLLMALVIFELFRRSRVANTIGRLAIIIAPSMFSVYMFHGHSLGFRALKDLIYSLTAMGFPLFIGCVLAAIVVFFVSVFLDVPRRFFVHMRGKYLIGRGA